MRVTKRSPLTGLQNTMDLDITERQYVQWKFGNVKIQDAMPNLSPDEREFLMTGYTAEDWKKIFGPTSLDDEVG